MSEALPSRRSLLSIPRMDCLAEEQLVRVALAPISQRRGPSFDLAARTVTVWHEGEPESVLARLEPLGLGARLSASVVDDAPAAEPAAEAAGERRTLWLVLSINATMFVIEIVAGWLARSTGLLADALDMFADAMVYGLALYAVGRPAAARTASARLNGWLQVALALAAFGEVARRAVLGSRPEPPAMIGVSLLALAANVTSLALVARHRHAGIHMRASVICSANDVLANLGVIVAGLLVAWSGSPLPDLAIGAVIAALVLRGAVRILRLR